MTPAARARCSHCDEPLVIVLEWDDEPIIRRLTKIEEKLEKIMTTQDDINSAVTAIQAVTTDLGSAVANIQAEIAALQGQGVDTSGLTDAVAQLQGVQASVDALETPDAPPADGGDAPVDGSGDAAPAE